MWLRAQSPPPGRRPGCPRFNAATPVGALSSREREKPVIFQLKFLLLEEEKARDHRRVFNYL